MTFRYFHNLSQMVSSFIKQLNLYPYNSPVIRRRKTSKVEKAKQFLLFLREKYLGHHFKILTIPKILLSMFAISTYQVLYFTNFQLIVHINNSHN